MPVNGVNGGIGGGFSLNSVSAPKTTNVRGVEAKEATLSNETIASVVDIVSDGVEDMMRQMEEMAIPEETKFVQEDERVVASESDVVNRALAWAIKTVDDPSVGYSNDTRWGNPNYDCSSFVISAYEAAGFNVRELGAYNTGSMREAFLATGEFEWIPGNPGVDSLQPGDILLNEASHVEIYAGNGNTLGAHDNFDYADGDSSGNEVNIEPYSGYYIDGVLRYTGS